MTTAKTTTMGRRVAMAAITDPTLQPNPGPLTALLVDSTHVFGVEYAFADEVPDEIAATDYARTIVDVIGLTEQVDGRVSVNFDTTSFGVVGGALDATISGCYLFADSGDPTTSPVMHAIPFTTQQTTDGTPLSIVWSQIAAQFVPIL